jgi:hypothetical protein
MAWSNLFLAPSTSTLITSGVDTTIQLGFGTGMPADLIKIVFKTGAYTKGAANEDLSVLSDVIVCETNRGT